MCLSGLHAANLAMPHPSTRTGAPVCGPQVVVPHACQRVHAAGRLLVQHGRQRDYTQHTGACHPEQRQPCFLYWLQACLHAALLCLQSGCASPRVPVRRIICASAELSSALQQEKPLLAGLSLQGKPWAPRIPVSRVGAVLYVSCCLLRRRV